MCPLFAGVGLWGIGDRRRLRGGLLLVLPPRRAERFGLLAAQLVFGCPVPAPQLEVLADGVLENTHRAEAYRQRGAASDPARSTRFFPARFAR